MIKFLTELRTQKFKGCKKRDDRAKVDQMYENLWSMFDLPKNRTNLCVSDFTWTSEVKKSFYDWGFHKALVKKLKNRGGMDWGMWVLQCEPSDSK
jgi:hypothetical protein